MNLRLVLAGFGLITCALLALALGWTGHPAFAVAAGVLAAVALVDLVVIQLRRRRARRTHTDSGSLFG